MNNSDTVDFDVELAGVFDVLADRLAHTGVLAGRDTASIRSITARVSGSRSTKYS
jgi:hypothetical protein